MSSASDDTKHDTEGDNALGEPLQINPEILKGFTPLPDLDRIEGSWVRPTTLNAEALKGFTPLPNLDRIEGSWRPPTFWERWSEGILIHLLCVALVAALVFIATS